MNVNLTAQLPSTSPAANAAPKKELTQIQKDKIHKTAQDFEAVFLNEMLKPMFAGINSEDSAFGGSREEATYQSMMVEQLGKSVASRGGIGIADHVEKEMLKMQEVAINRPTQPQEVE